MLYSLIFSTDNPFLLDFQCISRVKSLAVHLQYTYNSPIFFRNACFNSWPLTIPFFLIFTIVSCKFEKSAINTEWGRRSCCLGISVHCWSQKSQDKEIPQDIFHQSLRDNPCFHHHLYHYLQIVFSLIDYRSKKTWKKKINILGDISTNAQGQSLLSFWCRNYFNN